LCDHQGLLWRHRVAFIIAGRIFAASSGNDARSYEAAVRGLKDDLRGLKENVIVGD